MIEELMRIFSSFEFASPFYFWMGGAAILLLIFLPLLRKRALHLDSGYWIKKVPELKNKKFWILPIILIVITSLLIAAALANPQIIEKRDVSFYGKPVMVVIDVSGSVTMTTERFSPFERAKEIFYDIAARDTGATIGLSFYSSESYIARYFAPKIELLEDTIENKKEIEEISLGTYTNEVLWQARRFFSKDTQTGDKAIILISDLMDDFNLVTSEMAQVLEDGINLYVIVIEEDSQSAYQRIQIIKSKLGSNKIKMVWFEDREGINQICEEIRKMESSFIGETEILSRRSLMPFLSLLIIGLVILSAVFSETVFRKIP